MSERYRKLSRTIVSPACSGNKELELGMSLAIASAAKKEMSLHVSTISTVVFTKSK